MRCPNVSKPSALTRNLSLHCLEEEGHVSNHRGVIEGGQIYWPNVEKQVIFDAIDVLGGEIREVRNRR